MKDSKTFSGTHDKLFLINRLLKTTSSACRIHRKLALGSINNTPACISEGGLAEHVYALSGRMTNTCSWILRLPARRPPPARLLLQALSLSSSQHRRNTSILWNVKGPEANLLPAILRMTSRVFTHTILLRTVECTCRRALPNTAKRLPLQSLSAPMVGCSRGLNRCEG